MFSATDARYVRDACMCLNTRELARALTAAYDLALEPSGLRMTQFAVLAHVRALADPSIGELAAAMSLDQTTASRNVDALRRNGLLATSKIERRTVLAVTDAGQAALDRAYPLWKAAQRASMRHAGGQASWMRIKERLVAIARAAKAGRDEGYIAH